VTTGATPGATTRPTVHVVYEHGVDYRPYSSAYIRLLRPLGHPLARERLDVTFGIDFHGRATDLVVVDRLWRPEVTIEAVTDLVKRVRQSGARLLYSLDDSFFDLAEEGREALAVESLGVVAYLLQHADAVLVSTPALRDRLSPRHDRILVVANQLDERLLVRREPAVPRAVDAARPLVIGCMGTFTHDDDLMMAVPALGSYCRRHAGRVRLEIVGAVGTDAGRAAIADLPVAHVYPRPEEHEYPLFMLWYTASARWDLAIAPLRDTPFNRCKSDIKHLDYTAIGAPGIFSRTAPYLSADPAGPSVEHGRTGWLVDADPTSWEDAFETLAADGDLRQAIALGASRHLREGRTLAHRAADWVDAVTSCLE